MNRFPVGAYVTQRYDLIQNATVFRDDDEAFGWEPPAPEEWCPPMYPGVGVVAHDDGSEFMPYTVLWPTEPSGVVMFHDELELWEASE